MQVRFVHTADVHMGMSFAGARFGARLGLKRREEIKQTFFKILDRCIEGEAALLLIAGDLFEEAFMDMSTLKDVQKKFESMAGVQIVMGAGNHDAILGPGSGYRLMTWSPNVHLLGTDMQRVTLDDLNMDIYGFSWDKKEMAAKNFEALKVEDETRTNILMLHGDIYNQSPYLPLNIYDLLDKNFDYIALGHIHKPDCAAARWAYPGSPEPLDFKETGEHGIVEGVFDGHEISKSFVAMAQRRFRIIEAAIDPDMSFEEIKSLLLGRAATEEAPQDLYRFIIKGTRGEHVRIQPEVIKEALEEITAYAELIDETKSSYDIERIKMDNANNLIGGFIRFMQEKGLDNPIVHDALYEGLDMLLREKVQR